MDGIPNLKYAYTDKFEHVFAYATMTFFWVLSYQLNKIKVRLVVLILSIVLFGAIIEIMQVKLTAYRTGDFLDIAANSIGILFGCLFFKLVNRIYLHV